MKKKILHEIIIWSVITLLFLLMSSVEVYRAKTGYFTNGYLISISSILYILLFGLIVGYVVNKFLRRVN